MTSIMIALGGPAFLAPQLVDGLPRRYVIAMLGLTRVDSTGLLIACAFAVVGLLAPTDWLYEDAFDVLQGSWMALPSWHAQRTSAFTDTSLGHAIPPVVVLLTETARARSSHGAPR